MDMTRRFFLGGAAAFGCARVLAAPGFAPSGKPNLTFGVVSDLHIRYDDKTGKGVQGYGGNALFRKTLGWFREQGVDAVVIAGDLADYGLVEELEAVATAWYDVFPNDRYSDGRPIEKVFVYGNHDFHGYLYGSDPGRKHPDPEDFRRHVLRSDLKGNWERIFHEEYRRVYAKTIKGYRFIGQHWDDGSGMEGRYGWAEGHLGEQLEAYLKANGKDIDPSRPFFYVQHPHPKDTCYGSWAWGHDRGDVTRVLSAYPNAIAISGHSHYSLTDERSVWQGAFTSVGASSLRYTGMPYDERAPIGYENTTTEGKDAWRYNAVKLSPLYYKNDCAQGMLWRVYDDCAVVKRREFNSGLDLGPDWVLPLPMAERKPFAFAERAKKIGVPRFAEGAKLELVRVKVKRRGGKSKDGKESIGADEKDVLKIIAPAAIADPMARAYEYEFAVEGQDGKRVTKLVMAEGFNHAPQHRRASGSTSCAFALEELPKGSLRVSVTPMNCFHVPGSPLMAQDRVE